MIRLMLSVSRSVMHTQLSVSLIMSRSENFDKDAMGACFKGQPRRCTLHNCVARFVS